MENPKKVTGKPAALAKAQHYCAYQERSQQEVRNKLYDLGMPTEDAEEIISELIRENFLNEGRFASAYAQGKMRIRSWGRIKIKHGLRLKKVSDPLIAKALNSLDPAEYRQVLETLLIKKAALSGEKHSLKQQQKLREYALGKGFENELVAEILNSSKLS